MHERTLEILVITIAATSCATKPSDTATTPARVTTAPVPAVAAAAPARVAGRVLRADGTPAAGAVVVISGPTKGDQRAIATAAADGTFSTDLPADAYAFAAMDAQQWGYEPVIDARRGSIELRLDPSCHALAGRLSTRSNVAGPVILRFPRYSEHRGDVFGAVVSADGRFRACVPDGRYLLLEPDGFAERLAAFVTPFEGELEYRNDAVIDVESVPRDATGISPQTRAAFVAGLLPSTRVLGLGESNHGTADFYVERTALALELARKHGVRLFMIEAGYGEMLAIDDYVNGASVDIARAVQDLGYWIYDTKTFLRTIEEIRTYNRRVPRAKRIRMLGFDMQTTVGAVRYLRSRRPAVASQEELARLAPLAADSGAGWKTLGAEDRAAIRTTLERIARTRDTKGANTVANRAALAARSLLLRFDLHEATDWVRTTKVRDVGMARMALEILAAEPGARATLWAHLGHLNREYVVGAPAMGAHLAAALGDSYRTYALLALAGTARAWDSKGEVGVIPHELEPLPEHSLERVLAARSGGATVSYWTFSRAIGEMADWLKGIRVVRAFGARKYGADNINVGSFDGAILFSSVSPTEPTPTGERRAKPKQ